MSSQERILKIITLGIVVMLGMGALYAVWSRASATIAQKKAAIKMLSEQIDEHELTIAVGSQAIKQLEQLNTRSLPKEPGKARSLYQDWLLGLVDRDQVGINKPSVKVTTARTRASGYERLRFEVRGEATLERVTRFLYHFYSSDDLHRIQNLVMSPIAGRKELDVTLWIDALVLPEAKPREAVGNLASTRLKNRGLADYEETILERNIFSPANVPPRLSSVSDQRVSRGRSFRMTLRADDPDPLDKLTYSVDEDSSHAVQVDASSGTLRWTPRENGDYEVTVRVTDDGIPRRSDSRTFKITVTDPPPPREASVADDEPARPRFDEATHAFIVATLSKGDKKQVWLNIRTRGRVLKLSEGDRFSVGTVRGVVRRIDNDNKEAEIETNNGNMVIQVGQHLLEGKVAESAAVQSARRD